jgi:anthranilate phosphoribosyltransferase
MVVSSADGMDEFSLSASTEIEEAEEEFEGHCMITPEDVGLATVEGHDYLRGGDASENAAIITSVLAGEQGPRADVVLLNAGAAIYVAGKTTTIKDGVEAARESIASGRAAETLGRYVQASQNA